MDCDEWSIKTETLFLQHIVKFKLGESGRDVTMDGREISFNIKKVDTNRYNIKDNKNSIP